MALLFESAYINSVIAAERTDGMRLSLVAGTHENNFPYFGDLPWDNVLLCVGSERLGRTVREQGLVRFDIDTSLERGKKNCGLVVEGALVAADSGEELPVSVEMKMVVQGFGPRQEGKRYDILDLTCVPGLRWHPFFVESGTAEVRVGDKRWFFDGVTGQIEHGLQTNFQTDSFAFYYDYQALVRAGSGAYTYLAFETHALGHGVLSRLLDKYMVQTGSEQLTLSDSGLVEGNPHQAGASGDITVVFENSVDLRLSRLRRQLVAGHDNNGVLLTGLREIFESPR